MKKKNKFYLLNEFLSKPQTFLLSLTGILIGYLLVYFVLNKGIRINIFLVIFLGFVIYYVSFLIHELTHLEALKSSGFSIAAFIVSPFVWFRKDERTCVLSIAPFQFRGGQVIASTKLPQNEKELKKIIKDFADSLIYAPLGNLILVFMSVYFLYFSYTNFNNDTTLFYIYFSLGFFVLLNINHIVFAFTNTKQTMGDFTSYFKMKNDECFALSQILFSSSISFDFEKQDKTFILEKLSAYFEKKTSLDKVGYYDLAAFDFIVYKFLCKKIPYMPQGIKKYMDLLISRFDELFLSNSVDAYYYMIIYHHIALYYIKNDDKDVARNLISKMELKVDSRKNKMMHYLTLRAKHLLGDGDYSYFLNDERNFVFSNFSNISMLFTNPVEEEKIINKKEETILNNDEANLNKEDENI